MATYNILSWRGIPAQVRARDEGGARVSRALPEWFQQEIDRVAMREGLGDSDAYLAGWAWSADAESPGTAADVVGALVAKLISEWGDERR
jgi:Virulence factor